MSAHLQLVARRGDGVLEDYRHAGVVHVDALHLRPGLSSNILGLSRFLIEGFDCSWVHPVREI